jgi:twinkle protein
MQASESFSYQGDYAGIRTRKLTEETCRKFNVKVSSGPVVRFPYYSGGQVVAYKERDQQKNFTWKGKNVDQQLFGQQLFGSGKTIVITEGEFDCLSVWQARNNWPVVSVQNGAQSAKKSLQAQLKFLLGFSEIVLMFDGDSAGQQAMEECVALFPSDQVFIATIAGYKDASEALMAGDGEAIRQAYYNKRSYVPQAIIDGRDLFDLVSTPLHGRDADYPYPSLNTITGGLRRGEVVTYTAASGAGKSTSCGELAVHLIEQGETVAHIALEESVQRTGLRLMTVAANKPLHLDNQIDEQHFRKAFDSTLGSGRVFLRDGFGSVDPDALLNDIRFLVKTHGVEWVILDHLSILLSGNDSHDERKMIDIVMTKLRSFVQECNIGMILVSHLKRIQGDKGHEDGARVSMSQLRGSGSIAQLSDLVIALERDISKGDNRSKLVVLKNRFNGQTGPAGELAYDKETGRLMPALFDPIDSTTTTDYEF